MTNGMKLDVQGATVLEPVLPEKGRVWCPWIQGGSGVDACLRRWRQRGYSADRVVKVGGRSRSVCKQKTGAKNDDAMRCGAVRGRYGRCPHRRQR
jgi:hypothetical protein